MEKDDFSDTAGFLGNLARAAIKFNASGVFVHSYTKLLKYKITSEMRGKGAVPVKS